MTDDAWGDGASVEYVTLCACGSKTIVVSAAGFVCAECGSPFAGLTLLKSGAPDVTLDGIDCEWQ